MILDFFSAILNEDFKQRIINLLRIYYNALIDKFYIGVKDSEGYPVLKGDSVDFIPRNIIKHKGKLIFVDNEWSIESNIPADYVLYRCIKHDVIGSQKFWVEKKVKNIL